MNLCVKVVLEFLKYGTYCGFLTNQLIVLPEVRSQGLIGQRPDGVYHVLLKYSLVAELLLV